MMHTEESYRRYWATLTGKPEREIYVPVAIRTFEEGEIQLLQSLSEESE